MAVLTTDQLAQIRQDIAPKMLVINYNKAQVDAASQAIDTWFDNNQASLVSAINAATAPLVLTAAQKKVLVAYWLKQRTQREGAV